MGLSSDGVVIFGTVLKGVDLGQADNAIAYQTFPGVNGVGAVMNGVRGRMLQIPIRVWGAAYHEANKLTYLLTTLRTAQEQARQTTLTYETGWGSRVLRHVVFRGFVELTDIIPDVAGTLGGSYSLTLLLLYEQLLVQD